MATEIETCNYRSKLSVVNPSTHTTLIAQLSIIVHEIEDKMLTILTTHRIIVLKIEQTNNKRTEY